MRIVYVISFFVLAIVGCESQSAYVEPLDDVIMPLALGNTWVYELTRFADDGSVSTVELDTTRVVKVTNYTGEVRYYTYFENDMGSYFTNRPDGLWSGGGDAGDVNPHLYLPYPSVVGQYVDLDRKASLRYDDKGHLMPDTLVTRMTVVELNSTVSVKAGTYTCRRYELTEFWSSGLVFYRSSEYYIPNVGLVLREATSLDLNRTMKLSFRAELLSRPLLY
jgi:hypothetical protein